MLNSITFYNIFGLSVLMYLGILGMLSLIATVFVVVANKKGWAKIPVTWHMRLAGITFVIALIHGLLAILSRF